MSGDRVWGVRIGKEEIRVISTRLVRVLFIRCVYVARTSTGVCVRDVRGGGGSGFCCFFAGRRRLGRGQQTSLSRPSLHTHESSSSSYPASPWQPRSVMAGWSWPSRVCVFPRLSTPRRENILVVRHRSCRRTRDSRSRTGPFHRPTFVPWPFSRLFDVLLPPSP